MSNIILCGYFTSDIVLFLLCENIIHGNRVVQKNKIKIDKYIKHNIDFLNYQEIQKLN